MLNTDGDYDFPYYWAVENWIEKHGYEVKNTSKPMPWVKDVSSAKDIRPQFDLIEDKTDKSVASIIDCIYSHALSFFIRWIEEHTNDKFVFDPKEEIIR